MDDIQDFADDGFDFGSLNVVDEQKSLDRPGGFVESPTSATLAPTPPSVVGSVGKAGKWMANKIIVTIMGTVILKAILHFAQVQEFLFYAGAALAAFGGWKVDPPEAIKDRVGGVISQVKGAVSPAAGDDDAAPKAPLKERLTNRMVEKVVEPAKEAVKEPAKKVVQKVEDGAERIKDAVEDVGEKLTGKAGMSSERHVGDFPNNDPFPEETQDGDGKLGGFAQDPRSRLDSAKEAIKGKVDAAAAEKERQAKLWYEKGPNGMCPGCAKPMRVSIRGTGRYGCVRCGLNSSATSIRAMGRPPMPMGFRGF